MVKDKSTIDSMSPDHSVNVDANVDANVMTIVIGTTVGPISVNLKQSTKVQDVINEIIERHDMFHAGHYELYSDSIMDNLSMDVVLVPFFKSNPRATLLFCDLGDAV